MAGMPKQGYKNLVLAGWVLDVALGFGTGGSGPCPRVRGAPQGWRERAKEPQGEMQGGRGGKAPLAQRRNLIGAELYSPAKDIGYFRDIGKK